MQSNLHGQVSPEVRGTIDPSLGPRCLAGGMYIFLNKTTFIYIYLKNKDCLLGKTLLYYQSKRSNQPYPIKTLIKSQKAEIAYVGARVAPTWGRF